MLLRPTPARDDDDVDNIDMVKVVQSRSQPKPKLDLTRTRVRFYHQTHEIYIEDFENLYSTTTNHEHVMIPTLMTALWMATSDKSYQTAKNRSLLNLQTIKNLQQSHHPISNRSFGNEAETELQNN